MQDEIPALHPLIGLVAGIALAPHLVESSTVALLTIVALLLVVVRKRRSALLMCGFALGIGTGTANLDRLDAEREFFTTLNTERFVVVRAPLRNDWERIGHAWRIRLERFEIETPRGDQSIDAPLFVYAYFEPPPVGLAAKILGEGHLRQGEDHRYFLTIKSRDLLRFEGSIPPWHPQHWNRVLAQRLRRASILSTERGLIEGVLLGRSERLDETLRTSYRDAGTYHLLIFSGLQIACAAALIALVLQWLRSPRVADVSLLLFAALAPPFIGASPSVARASVAIGVFALSRILRRPTSLPNLWCLAALLRLAAVPSEISDPGFQLTYAGAGALLFASRRGGTLFRWLAPLVAIELAITPLTLYYFQQCSIGGAVTTLFVSPFVLGILMIGALYCATLWTPFLYGVSVAHHAANAINRFAATATMTFVAPSSVAMVVGFGAALLALTLREKRSVSLALALLIPTGDAIRRWYVAPPAEASLRMLDVGQGESLLLRDREVTILIDAGGRGGDPPWGRRVMIPLLLQQGVRRVDIAILTHVHPDHCGGMADVLARLEVGEFWLSPRQFKGPCAGDILEITSRKEIPIRILRDGHRSAAGGFALETRLTSRRFRRSPENNSSVVLMVRAGPTRLLLTGDIEREAELELLHGDLRADVLKVAHHGSKSSTMRPFLEAAAPRIALISCGYHNSFGHPHRSVVERLERSGARVWSTDRSGTITVRLRGPVIEVLPQIDIGD